MHFDRCRYAPLVCGENITSAFPRHDAHHLLQTLIACPPQSAPRVQGVRGSRTAMPADQKRRTLTAYAAHDKDFFASDVRHCPLGDLHEHGEDMLLQRKAQILWRDDIFAILRRGPVRSESLVRGVRLGRG